MYKLSKDELKNKLKNQDIEILDYNLESDWHELRKKGIGGSDIGAILGVNKYKSAIDVYLDKVENIKTDLSNNNLVQWGIKLENVIREEFENRNNENYEVYIVPYSVKYNQLIANVDGIVKNKKTGKYGVLEIKTANQYTINDWKKGLVPHSYYAQVMHYLAVTGLDYGIIVVLIGGNEYKEFYIERNEEEIEMIKLVAKEFWEEHIITKQIPAPDGSDKYSEYQKELLNKYEIFENRIEIDEEKEFKIEKIETLNKEIKNLEEVKEKLMQELMKELIENEANLMIGDNFKVKLVTQNRNKIDPKFKKDYAEMINQYKEIEDKYKIPYKTNFLKIERIGE